MAPVSKLNAVTLSKPVTIDGEKVVEITLRKPSPGELRGLSMIDVLRMEVDTMFKLLPRITQPPLSSVQLSSEVDLGDFNTMAQQALLFFVTPEQAEGLQATP
ncbi:phage tail assembly protein [Leisingera sp. MMG026]|uniref:phage tail assembly protein n=1 Tax=Leisingera sp. MMG026 TaxID=2909982 RepID=UPI001F23D97B|nr:phage tail assembly protein [Leisingera sp. MMG026]MCF6432598.1 phage tail assembly protein [Leisingera sp. MMG026]